jgi:tetratricopeptide (TPR) repeat protein
MNGTGGAGALEERRRAVLRDLEELSQQVVDGEIDEASAARLEARYRAELDEVEQSLASRPAPLSRPRQAPVSPAPVAAAGGPHRRIMWGMAAVILVLAGAVVYLATRSAGTDQAVTTTTEMSLADQIAEMEAVVAAHPDINAMRIALADLYYQAGDVTMARQQYLAVVDNSPTPEEESEALGVVGWMDHLEGDPQNAAARLEQAVTLDPENIEAKLFLGVVRLDDLGDAVGALPLLEEVLAYPDLPSELQPEIEALVEEARAQAGGG